MKKISLITALALAGSSLGAVSLEEAIKGVTIDGNSFIRYVSNSGRNDGGQGYTMRFLTDINTGNIGGFSFNLGLFYHYGGTPTMGTKSDGNVNGSRADALDATQANGNRFGVSTLWAKYAFESTGTSITAGKLRLTTPLNDQTLDRGIGALAVQSYKNTNFILGYFDSWVADNQYIGGILSFNGAGQKNNIGNNLAVVGVNGDYDIAAFKLWYANADKLFNSVFGEFSIGDEYEFKAQVAYTNMYGHALAKVDGNRATLYYGGDIPAGQTKAGAKSRGLYTLQFKAQPIDALTARVGYVGSFGAGYGVALNNQASFSKAGKWWYDNFGNGRNGFAYSGQGGYENTHINLWYLAVAGKVSIVDLGLDIVGISGKNNFAVSGTKVNGTKVATINAGNRTFMEITPSIDINIAKGAKLSAYYAVVFGQINAQRLWTQISYKF